MRRILRDALPAARPARRFRCWPGCWPGCAACAALVMLTVLPWATGFAPSSGAWLARSSRVAGSNHGQPACRGAPCSARAALRRPAAGTRAVRATAASDDEAPKALVSPIAGASVSPDGFVVFLSYTAAGRYFEEDMYIPVVVSCQDTDVVRSPEALTLLQLIQGIDMGTPLLPPDALQKAYGEAGSVALTEVRVYPPENAGGWGRGAARGGDADLTSGRALDISSDEQMAQREEAIRDRAPDLVKALQTLNVEIDVDRAVDLLRTYASEDGSLDRAGFSDALAAARVPVNLKPPDQSPTFSLVAVTGESVGKEANVSAFVGLSLHLRHRVPIVVKGGRRAPGDTKDVEVNAESWDRHAFEANDVGASYPDWRSIEEITEEGKEMAKRTTQLFQEAKKEKIIQDLTKYNPPGFLDQLNDGSEDASA